MKNLLNFCFYFLLISTHIPAAQSEAIEDVEAFIDANLQHILQHEVGHALIELLALPVLSQEEDAADLYATMDVLDNFEDAEARQILTYAVMANLKMATEAGAPDIEDYYGEHDLDIQRAYRIVCLGFGTDSDAFTKMADRFAMPEGRRDGCIDDANRAWESWDRVLAPHMKAEGEAASTSITFEYVDDDTFTDVRDYMMAIGLLEDTALYLNQQFNTPSFALKAEACGEANAFFDPVAQTVSMCYELYDWLADMAENMQ